MSGDSLYIVIPVHNRMDFTRGCLRSLTKQLCKDFTVIVVNDGSTDGTEEMIFREFPAVIVLHGDGNFYWTKATNLGIQRALDMGAKRVMTLNDDTIAPGDFVESMITSAQAHPDSLVGAYALRADTQEPVYGGERMNWRAGSAVSLLDVLSPQYRHGLHPVSHYPGRGLMIPSKVFSRIGLFDEKRFPHGLADYDFTHRALRAGFPIYCNFDARLWIFPEMSGDAELRKHKGIRNYFGHIFGLKGGGNLKIFTLYAIRNCPRKYLPFFLLRGWTQRLLGYWIHDLVEGISSSSILVSGSKRRGSN